MVYAFYNRWHPQKLTPICHSYTSLLKRNGIYKILANSSQPYLLTSQDTSEDECLTRNVKCNATAKDQINHIVCELVSSITTFKNLIEDGTIQFILE